MSFAKVRVEADTLDDENRKFDQHPLNHPLFLNSVPKSGSHLLRNIIRMFVPVEQQYQAEFIQYQFLNKHLAAFESNMLSWGHLFLTSETQAAVAGVRHIVLVRDPYDWVLAQARFVLSNELEIGLDHLKSPDVPIEDILDLAIVGQRPQLAPLAITFHFNAVAWLERGIPLLRYEDLIAAVRDLDGHKGKRFFLWLFEACGISLPDDWRKRVRIGADRKQSGTAREKLTGASARVPSVLPDGQKALVDRSAPGLRALLGYE